MSTNQEIITALHDIEDAEGRLTPESVVDAARDEASPLHSRFEWDDTKAAVAHRLSTARKLIISVKIPVRYEKIDIRAPIYARNPSEPGYRNTMKLRSEPEEAHAALASEMARVARTLRRARNLAVVLGMADQLDEIETQVSGFVGDLETTQPAAAA